MSRWRATIDYNVGDEGLVRSLVTQVRTIYSLSATRRQAEVVLTEEQAKVLPDYHRQLHWSRLHKDEGESA